MDSCADLAITRIGLNRLDQSNCSSSRSGTLAKRKTDMKCMQSSIEESLKQVWED